MFSLTMLCSLSPLSFDYSLILLSYSPHLVESELDHSTEIPWTWSLLHPHTLYGRVGAGGVHVAGTTGGFAFWGVS
jgi:hypothetical protein